MKMIGLFQFPTMRGECVQSGPLSVVFGKPYGWHSGAIVNSFTSP